MQIPDDFAGRLRMALKLANLSAGALGAAVGVDKSVVSRWMSGKVQPTQHNTARIAGVLARRFPGLSVLSFEAPAEVFRAALHLGQAAPEAPAALQSLPIPFGLLDAARKETARRGIEYFGIFSMYYWAFSQPGRVARMALILRPKEGLIEARYGAQGFEFRGWALLMLNRLHVMFAEERFEAMAFLVTNAGQQPRARFITGVLSGPAEGLLVPTASPAVLVREQDLSGAAETDLAAYDAARDVAPVIDAAAAPTAVRSVLERAVQTVSPLMQVPYAAGED